MDPLLTPLMRQAFFQSYQDKVVAREMGILALVSAYYSNRYWVRNYVCAKLKKTGLISEPIGVKLLRDVNLSRILNNY